VTSKIGLHMHSLAGRYEDYLSFIAEAQPAAILLLFANAPWLREALAVSPRTIPIQRKYCDRQPLENPQREAEELASSLAASSIYPIIAEHGGYWLGYNEIPGHRREERKRLNEMDWWMAEYAHRAGVRYACLSASVGRFHVDLEAEDPIYEWRDLFDAMRAADAIAWHAYNAPRVDDPRDRTVEIIDGEEVEVWWRIRRPELVRRFLPEDLLAKRWIATEGVIDSGAAGGPNGWDPGGEGGWRSFMDPAGHLADIQWFDEWMQSCDWMMAGMLFGWGTEDPTWDTFDPSKPPEMYHLLLNYLKKQNHGHGLDDPAFREWLAEEAQRHVIPMTAGTYFRQVQRERGWDEAMSDEFYPLPGVVAQVFYSRADNRQHIVYAEVGRWQDYRLIEREN